MGQVETFSIRQLIELTGLSEFTIRGWENRYLAFQPQRSQTGRREYRKHDLERALLFRELLKRGHRIGSIASLGNHQLRRLFEEDNEGQQKRFEKNWSADVTETIELMSLQQWDELEAHIRNHKAKDTSLLIREFFLPVLGALSANVGAGLVSISQEHTLCSLLKERIYVAINSLPPRESTSGSKARFVLATPEGDHHEIGLLLANLMIRAYGFQSLYLGTHTPARDLAETALRFKAAHILIVATVTKLGGAKREPLSYVAEVQKNLGGNAHILFAGRQAKMEQDPTSLLSFISDFESLETYLKKIRRRT